jgi:hypothetical protein
LKSTSGIPASIGLPLQTSFASLPIFSVSKVFVNKSDDGKGG